MALIFDCETFRVGNAADLVEPILPEPVKADGRLTDPVKITADLAKKEAAELERVRVANQKQLDECALYPYTACLVALGWAWPGDQIATVRIFKNEREEADGLREFWSMVVDPVTHHVMPMIGFNSRAFDLPLLSIRSMLLGVPAPQINVDRFRSPHPDVMRELTMQEAIRPPKGQGSLRWFARRFGLPCDDAFSGDQVAQLVESNNWDAVRSHCEWDVMTCKAIAERIGLVRTPIREVVA